MQHVNLLISVVSNVRPLSDIRSNLQVLLSNMENCRAVLVHSIVRFVFYINISSANIDF